MSHPQKFHFIAIGGSVMHNLAIALHQAGHQVTGSDDDIQDPSKSELAKHNLLPDLMGWFPDKLDNTYDAVILGMHARKDNPELAKAQSLGLPVFSFPEFIYQQSQDKQRIVICGSHGKTTITALIVHVLAFHNRKFDYVIGAQVEGIENTVRLSDAPVIVIEGDEYPCSAIDPTAKFLKYRHHVAVLSGISWDHANVFPSKDEYTKQFELLADATPKGGTLVYNSEDPISETIGKIERADVQAIPYKTHAYTTENQVVYLTGTGTDRTPTQLFGKHNLQNISAAKELLKKIGITSEQFYQALPGFKGAKGRLQKIFESDATVVFKDFAHAPSKVKATIDAVKELYPSKHLTGCLELHTFSSLNKKFLPEYKDTMKACNTAVVYFNPEVVAKKNLESLTEEDVKKAFNDSRLNVFTDSASLAGFLQSQDWANKSLIMMSSGHFNGLDLNSLTQKISN